MQLRHRLDDRLVVSDDLIDDKADTLRARRNDDDLLVAIGLRAGHEHLAQAHEGHQLLAHREEASAAGAQIFFRRKLEAFLDRGERDDIAPGSDTHEQAVDDGERERDAQRNVGS